MPAATSEGLSCPDRLKPIFRQSKGQWDEAAIVFWSKMQTEIQYRWSATRGVQIERHRCRLVTVLYLGSSLLRLNLATMETSIEMDAAGSRKWRIAALGGFQPVPHVLLMKQQELGLDLADMVVLLNLTSHWWFKDQPPFLRTNIIAARTGVTVRTVQRVIRKLLERGYITRGPWTDAKGETRQASFFEGLIKKLEELTLAEPVLEARVQRALSKENELRKAAG